MNAAGIAGRRPARIAPLLALLACAAVAGCKSTTVIDKYAVEPVNVTAGDAVVVLGRRTSAHKQTEEDFVTCVGKAIAGTRGVTVVPERTFLDAVYPWFESSTAPTDVRNLDKLMTNSALARKFAELRIRYFVWLDGYTETVDRKGSISCAVGPGGGGCFGFARWDDAAQYEASIWDLRNLNLAGKISAETKGTSYMPAIIIPIPLLARVQSAACQSMADQLAQTIGGDTSAIVQGTPAPAPAAACAAADPAGC
ncbi:MAG: hypothetical protein AB7Q97_20745 [Gammaproteobacteria bacterium]